MLLTQIIVQVQLKMLSFFYVGNDAVDISGTRLKIDDVLMNNIGDKGLSAGENSQIIANNLKISEILKNN